MHTDAPSSDSPPAIEDRRLARLHRRLTEAFDDLWDNVVDPDDAFHDADGARWSRLGASGGGASGIAFDEQQLAEIRGQCRALALSNEFAINGHEKPLALTAIRCGSE